MTRRGIVRLVSYLTGAFVVVGVFAITGNTKAYEYRIMLENTYERSLEDLGLYISNISADLNKGIYAGSGSQLGSLSAKIWRESGAAKSSLSALPVAELNLENTYRFLSQVGDYTMNLSEKTQKGASLTAEEKKTLDSLSDYAKKLTDQIYLLINDFERSSYSLADIKLERVSDSTNDGPGSEGAPKDPSMSDGFQDMETGFEGYPKLIYDGPFSDHIMQRKPAMLENIKEISQGEALKRAATILNKNVSELQQDTDQGGNLPGYCFKSDTVNIAITKHGGLLEYLLNSRQVKTSSITLDQALQKAEAFLNKLDIDSFKNSYYEISQNVMTINFAHMQDNVIVYPDLIKVGVALDNGEIVEYSATGYIMNNHARKIPAAAVSVEEASKVINPRLHIIDYQMAIIPTDGMNEKLCYEFLCQSDRNEKVLVYINAADKTEEQLLILIESENGTLTI